MLLLFAAGRLASKSFLGTMKYQDASRLFTALLQSMPCSVNGGRSITKKRNVLARTLIDEAQTAEPLPARRELPASRLCKLRLSM